MVLFALGKHVRAMNPPLNPTSYRKTGVCKGITNFLIFDPKHTLCVLVRTALARRFLRVPTINVLSENKKSIKHFLLKFSNFTSEKNLRILHGRVFVTGLPTNH